MSSATLLLIGLCVVGSSMLAANAASPEELALRNAIISPVTKTIVLKKSVTLTADLPELAPNKVLAVTGRCGKRGRGKCTIYGAKKYRLFRNSQTTPVSLVLDNLIITGAKSSNGTAAVAIGGEGTTLTVKSVKFADNPRALELYIVQGTITKSWFVGHTMSAVYTTSEEGLGDDVKFVSCRFANNKAAPGLGGGAIFVGKYASITVVKSRFVGNSADYRGGALRFFNSFGIVRRSRFIKNTAKESGGAITVYNSGLRVFSSLLQENVAQKHGGGAIRVSAEEGVGSFVSFYGSAFVKNRAPKSFGGAFVLDTNSEIVFCRSELSGNTGKKGARSNGYIIGPGNAISTNPVVTIPAIESATGGSVVYNKTGDCSL